MTVSMLTLAVVTELNVVAGRKVSTMSIYQPQLKTCTRQLLFDCPENSHKRVRYMTLSQHFLPTGAACLAADLQVEQLCQDTLCPVLNFPFFSLAFGMCAIIGKRECGIAVSAPSLHHHGCCFLDALW